MKYASPEMVPDTPTPCVYRDCAFNFEGECANPKGNRKRPQADCHYLNTYELLTMLHKGEDHAD
jgi:hypothetical protein